MTIGKARLIRAKFDLDIIGDEPTTMSHRLYNDAMLRIGIVWLAVDDAEGRTEEDFESALDAASFKRADEAFWKELANFILSLNPARATAIQKLLGTMSEISQKQLQLLVDLATSPEAVSAMERTIETARNIAIGEINGVASGGLPEGSRSTHAN